MSYAIIKPDHLGDLVLSSAAIRAVAARCEDVVLFVAPGNIGLARLLFPEIEVRQITFGHLAKHGVQENIPDLSGFELVIFLRSDGLITSKWAELRTRNFVLPMDTHQDHQSLIDYTVTSCVVGDYDIDRSFAGDRLERLQAKAIQPPRTIGLSIGSGFHANTWPVLRWIEMARALLPRSDGVSLICGPAERDKAAFIADRLGRPSGFSVVAGGDDIAGFLDRIDTLDLVVATDGGSGHLCSLVTPVVSVFGPSPFRRYAPFGRHNRLLTRQLGCSPCCQYASSVVNGCLTTECMSDIGPADVIRAVDLKLNGKSRARTLPPERGVYLHVGVSHIDRERKLAGFHDKMAIVDAAPFEAA